MQEKNYADINSKAIDNWVEHGWVWGIPISHETFTGAKNGKWDVLLTPIKPVPREWFLPFLNGNSLAGVTLLGLASGGGQQMPIFAALGASCTVLDNSGKQLESERLVSQREGYEINIVKGDMTKRLPFDAGFTLADLYEDHDNDEGNAIGQYYPPFIATRAIKP